MRSISSRLKAPPFAHSAARPTHLVPALSGQFLERVSVIIGTDRGMTNPAQAVTGGPRCRDGTGTAPVRGRQVEDLVGSLFSGPDEAHVRRWRARGHLRGLFRPRPF